MEKSVLTEFEKKCIQEEPAYCTAACPFHMDVKAFLGHMAEQEFDKAFTIIEKTLPLPEILARICDHPCEHHCIRNDIDAPLAIGTLERVCAVSRTKQKKRFLPPPRGKTIGIWGSGLSSLVAAWDLGLKGYTVVVYDQSPVFGGNLRKLSKAILPEKILDRELKNLGNYGVVFKTAVSPNQAFGEEKIQAFDAVYLGFDSPGEPYSGIVYDRTGRPETDDFTLQTSDPKIFAGGFSSAGKLVSQAACPISDAAQGRKAATTIDRVLSNVSITAGREREGACSTRLSTDISKVKVQPRIDLISDPVTGSNTDPERSEIRFNPERAAWEAKRCIQCDCSRCVRVCTYIDAFKGFPGRYAREIYNNASIVMGEKKANLLINSCCLCTLCETVCPHDFSMTDLCLAARQEMVEKGKMPVFAHEFALREMAWASGEDCFFARHEPGKNQSSQLFFPGCQLLGSAPGQVRKVYDFLRTYLSGSTGFVSGCCGAPARWAGREALFEQNCGHIRQFWEASGKPLIITACPSCTQMLGSGLKEAKIMSLFQLIVQNPDLETKLMNGPTCDAINGLKERLSDSINIIDPCTARDDVQVQAAVRHLAGVAGLRVDEIPASGAFTECCGYGGLVYNANVDLSKKMIQQRAAQSDSDFLAYCAMCRDRLAATGKQVIHVLDLFWPQTDRPEQRKDPGFSKRHDALALAKQQMLAQIWNEPVLEKSEVQDLRIHISPRADQILEDQFILLTDIRKVLDHFETGANHFSNSRTNSLIAFYRPNHVCFWVEFIKHNQGYEILNGWRHRMAVIANDHFVPGMPTDVPDADIFCKFCDQPLAPYKNHVEYLGSRFEVALPQCRQCGTVFISQALSLGKIAEVEKILEDK